MLRHAMRHVLVSIDKMVALRAALGRIWRGLRWNTIYLWLIRGVCRKYLACDRGVSRKESRLGGTMAWFETTTTSTTETLELVGVSPCLMG